MATEKHDHQGHDEHKEHHDHGHDEHGHHGEHEHHGRDEFFIHIDHKKYEVDEDELTGAEVRQLAKPPIGPEYDLYLETPGPGDDEKIADDQVVCLKHRMSFYSVLRQINPGAYRATA